MISQTRFKLAIGLGILYCIEGVIKAFLKEFPIEVVVGAQGAVAMYYFNRKTKSTESNNSLAEVRSTNECNCK